MTRRSISVPARRARLFNMNGWGAMLVSSLVGSCAPAFIAGCGGQATDPLGSTDTGNPPVIAETKLRVVASDDGVVVSGSKGAVTGGAEIKVTNLATNKSAETTADEEGSFEVAVEGGVGDAYRVRAELNGKSTQAELPAVSPDVELDGHTFLLETSTGYEQVNNTALALGFDESGLHFSAGCNSHAGPYSLCDDKLCVTGLSSTEIGCDAALQAQDEWLANFFTSTPSVVYTPPLLTLVGDGATLEFLDREAADPDRALTGRLWSIDTFIDGDAASNLPLMEIPTIRFEDDGSFAVNDTCNGISGSYIVDGPKLTLSDVMSTLIDCETDLAAQMHVAEVISAGDLTYTIEAARLTLMHGEVGLSATTE
jgi:heat shock protein HslJ